MQKIPKEESYAERRLLFKNIWDTAMQIEEKDADIMNKPKVIKTLRLDEVDKLVIGKRKYQKIKNLRTVCNRILEFCDRQDADDKFYGQVAECKGPDRQKLIFNRKKIRTHRRKKKIKKSATTTLPPKNAEEVQAEPSTSDKSDDREDLNLTITNPSPVKRKRTVTISKLPVKSLKAVSNPENGSPPGRARVTRRKLVKRRRSKRKTKKTSSNESPQCSSGGSPKGRYFSAPIAGRLILRRIKDLLKTIDVKII